MSRNPLDPFTTGYLECAEWLLDEDVNRDQVRGFSHAAIKQASGIAGIFNQAVLTCYSQYEAETGRDMSSAGHDFWLTRNHHGAGFWDRGNHPYLRELTDSAHAYGETYTSVYRGWIIID